MTVASVLQQFFLTGILAATFTVSSQETGILVFVEKDTSYVGAYSLVDRDVSVNIDGTTYTGHFVEQTSSLPAENKPAVNLGGNSSNDVWGHAFLFASSSQVLQCRFDTGFPSVSGDCQDALGRQFKVTSTSPFATALHPVTTTR